MDPRAEEERAQVLARHAAEVLDWFAVRDLLLPLAPSGLGRRALGELVPRDAADAADALVRAREMQALAEDGAEPMLQGAPDPVPGMRRAVRYSATLAADELWAIGRLLRLSEDIGHWLAARRTQVPRCDALWVGLPDLQSLLVELESALDRRGRVRDEASPALARAVEENARLGRELERTLKELANRPGLRTVLAEGHAGQVHKRGGRRVLAVRARKAGALPGIVHDRSQSGETIFVEPREVVAGANRIATIEADIERERSRILAALTASVLRRREDLNLVAGRLSELELAVISARYARSVNGRPARLPGEPGAADGLLLRALRHPLLIQQQELGHIDGVVPLDLRLGAEFDLLVITGPNTGGKTLAIKSAGLAALMTRMGLALPCEEGTTVPLYTGVVADIGDEQAIQQNLSTFSSHVERIRAGLERVDRGTLVLLDELGGGTDPDEGAALGDALLQHLLDRGIPTLASTHLGKLKEFAYRNARAENAHVEFDLESLAPAYSLVVGAPGESRALAIARRVGLPEELIEVAEQRLQRTESESEALMGEMRTVRLDTERLRQKAEQKLHTLEQDARTLAGEEELLEERRAQLDAEAERGIEERIARARAGVERLRSMLPQLPGANKKAVEEVVDELQEALADALMSERRLSFLGSLKKGDHVWLPRFKKRCQVTRIWRDKQRIDVRLGKREMQIGYDEVTFYETL